jgi:hypothetical protein
VSVAASSARRALGGNIIASCASVDERSRKPVAIDSRVAGATVTKRRERAALGRPALRYAPSYRVRLPSISAADGEASIDSSAPSAP